MSRADAASRRVELVSRRTLKEGFCRVDLFELRHSLHAGGMSATLAREVTCRGEVAAVLPYDPVLDALVLLEQFRPGPYASGWADPWLREIVAGFIEPGETFEDVARREALEEAGVEVTALRPVMRYFPSPGASSESVQLFVGRVDARAAGGIHGLASEGEDIAVSVVPVAEAFALLEQGAFVNAATLIALQWLALHHEAVRADWLGKAASAASR